MKYYSLIIALSASIVSLHTWTQNIEWNEVIHDGDEEVETVYKVDFDSELNVYSCGYFDTYTAIGDSVFVSGLFDNSGYIPKYTLEGDFLWAVQLGRPDEFVSGHCLSFGCKVDNSDNVYSCGYFGGKVWFGDTAVTATGPNNIFLAKYSEDGNFLWVRTEEVTLGGIPRGLVVDYD